MHTAPRFLLLCLIVSCSLLLTACTDSSPPPTADVAAQDEPQAAEAAAAHPGEALYLKHCAACHDQAMYKAPSRLFVSMMGAHNILQAMNGGLMAQQAAAIDEPGRRAIAEYLSGQSLDQANSQPDAPPCNDSSDFDVNLTPVSAGWGVDERNSRHQPLASGGVSDDEAARLEVKWVFAYPNAFKARSQPGYGGGAIYFGSQDGTVRALDAKTGCLRWAFRATAEVRTAVVVAPWQAGDESADPNIYFGDLLARVYAVSARSGELRWQRKVEDHRDATLTATPALYQGRLYVPVSSLEVVPALDPSYACCTFRGSVVALDAASGAPLWKTHTIDETPRPAGTTRAGTTILAPSGAPVWTSPTIDTQRSRLYIGTGENYSSPADGNSDAIIAMDLETGQKIWVSQQTSGDAWNTGCLSEFTTDDSNCPEENGPDYDFGSSPILMRLDNGTGGGQDLLVAGQKSGVIAGLNPQDGSVLWRNPVGRGGVQGGVHFGMAAHGNTVYVPINDMAYPEDLTRYQYTTEARPGLYALDARDGTLLWSSPAPHTCADKPDCDPGISHAITSIPGAVIAGYLDGFLRVHSSEDGRVLWQMDTVREFESVSGATAKGGSFSGGGVLVAHGMVYANSGYGIYNHMPGNALIALAPAD